MCGMCSVCCKEGGLPTSGDSREAANEAIRFAGIHHRREAWIVPLTTLVPVLIFLRAADHVSASILVNITIAVFMGIAMALMSTYFAVTQGMQPVIVKLLEHCETDPYDNLPSTPLSFRFGLCSTLIVMTTALMIGTLASQRASQVLHQPDREEAQKALVNLRRHTAYITAAAVVLGVVFSTVLASSVTSRITRLVEAMENVRRGKLSLRVQPTGTDEVDQLGRQFNEMLSRLGAEQSDHSRPQSKPGATRGREDEGVGTRPRGAARGAEPADGHGPFGGNGGNRHRRLA